MHSGTYFTGSEQWQRTENWGSGIYSRPSSGGLNDIAFLQIRHFLLRKISGACVRMSFSIDDKYYTINDVFCFKSNA